MSTNSNLIRLSKLMADRGMCSRREADRFIEMGQVFVNGVKVTTLGIKVSPHDRITLTSEAMKTQKSLVSILLNKPIGYVSAQPENDYIPAVRLITKENYFGENPCKLTQDHFTKLAVAGRLDIDSQGLLLFTQDGRLVKSLIGEESDIEKEYLVRVRGNLSPEQLKMLNYGLSLDGKKLKQAHVEWLNQDQLRFILKEGKKRQIRRMCEAVGLFVLGLKRVRVGSLNLGNLPEGKWRFLTQLEVNGLKSNERK